MGKVFPHFQRPGLFLNQQMRTNDQAATPATTTTTTAQRLDTLSRIEKPERPAKTARINLCHTLEEKHVTAEYACTQFSFRVPAWLVPRLDNMHQCLLIRDFVQNAPFLSDPEHGEFTRARFLARYEEIMRHRDLWAHRDKEPTLECKVTLFTNATAKHLSLAAEFLRTSREQLMLAILTHAAMTRNPDTAPVWSDMAHLQACQAES